MIIRNTDGEESLEMIDRFSEYCDELTGYLVEYSEDIKKSFVEQFMSALNMGMKIKIAEEDGAVLGGIMYMDERTDNITGEKNGFILNLLVFPEHRGKGLAKSLIAEVAAELKEKGIESLRLNVFAKNKPAIDFYDRTGFVPYSMILEKKYR